MIEILAKYHIGFLNGLSVTLKLCGIVWLVGLSVGPTLGALGTRFPATVGRLTWLLSFVISGTPVLVFLFWLHYPGQKLLGVVVDPFYTAALALSVVNTLAVADTVRESMRVFPREFLQVGRVSGLSSLAIARHIQAPLLLRQIVPALLTTQVAMLQATLFASLISVDEIFRVAQQINATEYRPVEIYTALAVFFLLVCLPLNGVALILRRRFGHDLSER